jgi:hypothetical protein
MTYQSPAFNEVLQQIAVISIIANAALVYFGFKLVSFYVRQIGRLEDRYTKLAEMRDTTKIEDVMTTLERDIKAQNYRHEQEMLNTFNTTKSLLDRYMVQHSHYKKYNADNPQDVNMGVSNEQK